MRSRRLRLRIQVPGGVAQADQVPVALLLPRHAERQHDALPDRSQLRRAGHVRADAVLPGDVRDMSGEEDVRPVPQGPPGRILLPDRSVGANAVPRGAVLPAGVGQAQGVSGGQDVAGGEQVGQPVPMSGQRQWTDLEALAPRQLWRRQGLCALCGFNKTGVYTIMVCSPHRDERS